MHLGESARGLSCILILVVCFGDRGGQSEYSRVRMYLRITSDPRSLPRSDRITAQPVCVALGLRPRALSMLGRQST